MANYRSKKRSYKRRRKFSLKAGAMMGQAPAPGVPPGGPAPPTAKQESELVKIKKQLNESAKKVTNLEKQNQSLELDNNELRKKLMGVSEDIVILQRDLPTINNIVETLIKKINLYQVHQEEKQTQKSKNSKEIQMTIDPKGSFFNTREPEPEKNTREYKTHLNTVKKAQTNSTKKKPQLSGKSKDLK